MNKQYKIASLKHNAGYTLIELLVVSGILVAVSGIIGGILISTLRSTETTKSRTQITQSGNYALSAMSELVKRSKDVVNVGDGEIADFTGCAVDPPPTGESITLLMPEGRHVILSCTEQPQRIASRSGDVTYYLTSDDLTLVEEEEDAGRCSFTCNQSSRFSAPNIDIRFKLGQREGTSGVHEDTVESFQTQINSRNFIND